MQQKKKKKKKRNVGGLVLSKRRKKHDPEFKAKVALEALRGVKTIAEISSANGIHGTQIARWKKQVLEGLPGVFDPRARPAPAEDEQLAKLYEQIGRLQVELERLKKNLAASHEDRRGLVDPDHPELSIRRQCELLGVSRSSCYYEPRPERQENLDLMRRIDEICLNHPDYGSRRIAACLSSEGRPVNRKRVQRLMRLMGLESVYPRPRKRLSGEGHEVYPYLPRDVTP